LTAALTARVVPRAQARMLDSTQLAPSEFRSIAPLDALPAAGASGVGRSGGGGGGGGSGGGSGGARETARDALTWAPRPVTPPAIRDGGYQHYARQPPGVAVRRFGTARDPLPQGPFGCKSRGGQERAADCFNALPDSEVARWQLERAEDVYLRWVAGANGLWVWKCCTLATGVTTLQRGIHPHSLDNYAWWGSSSIGHS
jgi:hypothetical protein